MERATVIARDYHAREPVSVFTQRSLINPANNMSARGGNCYGVCYRSRP